MVNEIEASFITNKEVNNRGTAEKTAQQLMNLGPKLVILTLGTDGVIYCNKNETAHVPAFKVEAEDTKNHLYNQIVGK